MALIDAYSKPLTAKQAAHLLRRTTFGPSPQQVKDFTGLTADAAVTKLMQVTTADLNPTPPVDLDTGKSFVDQPYDDTKRAKHEAYTKFWWMGLMTSANVNILEKLTLFWQNHFVVAYSTVKDSRYMFKYNQLLRKNALGNYKSFVIEVTKDPSMLRYLNGNQNTKTAPNENYGRELQELFTIGVRKPDGTPNYTEDDIKAAARVLTGWRDTGYYQDALPATAFAITNHDTTDKVFSSYYGKTTIKGRTTASAGDDELKDLVDMILNQPETARNIVREMYRWFVNYDITPTIEKDFIEPLATIFRKDYEIKPVLSALLKSQHFFDDGIRGAIIKSPVDLIVGTYRFFSIPVPNVTSSTANFYAFTQSLYTQSNTLQQAVMDQPTVFGWRAYYDTDFYQIWINASTLAVRGKFTDNVINGVKVGGVALPFDTIAIAKQMSDPSDPEKLVTDLSTYLFAMDITQSQKDFLIDQVLLPGLPRYEWYPEWQDYIKDPTSKPKLNAVKSKLDALFLFMLRMAEYQVG
ncbi:MAG: DUF1800 domain-containing protein [Spirosomataceae bacterium]